MKPIIITFAGSIGSGKSTISSGIANTTGWQLFSFGDFIRTIASEHGLDQSRRTLQDLGEKTLIDFGPEKFCIKFLEKSQWKRDQPFIIDGIRHIEVLNALKKLVAPIEVFLIFITLSREMREIRLIKRDLKKNPNIDELNSHSTESQVDSILRDVADLTINGDNSVESLIKEVLSWILRVCEC